MNKYIKDNKIIEATERAYELIYCKQGYRPYALPSSQSSQNSNEPIEEKINLKSKIRRFLKKEK
jgi:hypothetical protein